MHGERARQNYDRLHGYNFKLFLPPTLLFFFVFLTHSVWLLSPVPAFSFFFHGVCAIPLSAGLVRDTPTRVKCVVRRAVKVIRRRACERTIEKLTYIHINIYIADFH